MSVGDMQEEIEMVFLQIWNIFCHEWDLGLFRFSAFGIFIVTMLVTFAGYIIRGLFFDD